MYPCGGPRFLSGRVNDWFEWWAMEIECPRCRVPNREVARFCARCGLFLEEGLDGRRVAGCIRHPHPAEIPDGYEPCAGAVALHFRTESSLGGDILIATEGINVLVFNSGYALREVVFDVRGTGKDGRELFAVERAVGALAQGAEAVLEIPSYELPAPLGTLEVALRSAEFDWEA